MLIMLLLVGMGRHYVQTVIKSVPTFTEKDLAEQSYKNTCTKSSCLRIHGNYICEAAFNMRKAHMIRKKTGAENVPYRIECSLFVAEVMTVVALHRSLSVSPLPPRNT